MSAEGHHGNKGIAMAGALLAVLAALGVGGIIAGMGWSGLGNGMSGFIDAVGSSLDRHPRMGMLLALFTLALTGGIAMMTLRKAGE
jgi:hypothetical protein